MTEEQILIDIATSISNDYQSIKKDLADIKKLLQYPSYVYVATDAHKEAAKTLFPKLCKPKKPGGIMALTLEEYELYKKLEICPPPRH